MTVAVVGGVAGFGAALAAALEGGSTSVVALPATDDPTEATAALARIAGPSAVVHVCAQDDDVTIGPLVATGAAEWRAGCEAVVWRALTTLQGAHAVLAPNGGGRVVVASWSSPPPPG
jgi:hypothetical protein